MRVIDRTDLPMAIGGARGAVSSSAPIEPVSRASPGSGCPRAPTSGRVWSDCPATCARVRTGAT